MGNNNDWLEEELAGNNQKTLQEVAAETKKKKQAAKKTMKLKGRPSIKGFKIEFNERAGTRAPLVMVYGSGPRQGKAVNVPIPPEVAEMVEKYTVGPKTQVLSLLIKHGLDQLHEHGKTLVATSIK